ncbi:MAG: hypothetical protein ABFC77_05815 [Thermoguttaceae bacterium]
MVEHDSGTLRTVAWAEVFPWLGLTRAFRIAIAVRMLLFGAVALLITLLGWGALGVLFGTDQPATDWLQPFTVCPWRAATAGVPDLDQLAAMPTDRACLPGAPCCNLLAPAAPWTLLSSPALEGLKRTGFSWHGVLSILLSGLWGVMVWAFFGAAMCRTAAVQLAAHEQLGVMASLRFAAKKWPAYCAAPLLPVGGILLAAVPVAILGFLTKANVGLLLAGLLWPLALVAGLFMTMLLAGLLFGWPLMWSAISVEGTDGFDALSRSYAYLFQRPLNYLFYIVVAGVIGAIGWILVQYFAAGVIWMTAWAAGWGGAVVADPNTAGRLGLKLVHFWTGCVKLLAVGYLFSYFWTASVGIYFLLRRDVDAVEMDEVELDADQDEPEFELPKVATDSQGAPETEDDEPQA